MVCYTPVFFITSVQPCIQFRRRALQHATEAPNNKCYRSRAHYRGLQSRNEDFLVVAAALDFSAPRVYSIVRVYQRENRG
ncbi:hypothetical protein Hamer_G024224 [Homarus americanus]|uniref:Uncharacterized protein n=1 Tax=Homarus americanus TaxID=6706 RepID=A0A8J5MNG9_HOMAM|nr:hypothetical protein Hamer_G024224 [Homarus americanus]